MQIKWANIYITLIVQIIIFTITRAWTHYEKNYRGSCQQVESSKPSCNDLGEHAYKGVLLDEPPKGPRFYIDNLEAFDDNLFDVGRKKRSFKKKSKTVEKKKKLVEKESPVKETLEEDENYDDDDDLLEEEKAETMLKKGKAAKINEIKKKKWEESKDANKHKEEEEGDDDEDEEDNDEGNDDSETDITKTKENYRNKLN